MKPATKTKIMISQSALKAFFGEGECRKAFKLEFLDGLGWRGGEPSAALIKGLIFEFHLIGSTRDGKAPHLPLIGVKSLKPTKSASKAIKEAYLKAEGIVERAWIGKTSEELDVILAELPEKMSPGEPSKPELDLIAYAKASQHFLEDLGIMVDQVQPEIEVEDLQGHLDLLAWINKEPVIIDVKYTETEADDRWRGWGSPEEMDHLQAVHYVDMMEKLTGHRLPFYYLVFGKPKEDMTPSWIKWIQVTVTEEALASHQVLLNNFRTALNASKFEPCGDFNICQGCGFRDRCDTVTKLPALYQIEI